MKKEKKKLIVSIINFALMTTISLIFIVCGIATTFMPTEKIEYNTFDIIGAITILIMVFKFISDNVDAGQYMIKQIKSYRKVNEQCKTE